MQVVEAYAWLMQGARRQAVLIHLAQPSTARQLSHLSGVAFKGTVHVLWELAVYQLSVCLNQQAHCSRVYWLTTLGAACQRRLREDRRLPPIKQELPGPGAGIDWGLYGWVCFSHRAAVIKALGEPLQPSAIKRRARQRDELLRMSANNVRDVIKLFLTRGVVCPVQIPGKTHLRYELTETGQQLRTLLLRAEVRG
jgi:hypothetical protein